MLRIAARQSTAVTARVLARYDALSLGATSSIDDSISTGSNCHRSHNVTCSVGQQQQQQQRFYSQSPLLQQSQQRRSNKRQNRGPLMNEHLVKFLVQESASRDANGVEVRLVVQPSGAGEKPQTSLVSLMEAVKVSNDLGYDLMAINVEQNPPTVKALDYAKMAFKANKKGSGGGGGGKKSVKEFKFKGTIAENDMLRKTKNAIEYLKKGHNCQITILSNAHARRKDPDCIKNIMTRLQNEVGDAATTSKITTNLEGTSATLILQPNSSKS